VFFSKKIKVIQMKQKLTALIMLLFVAVLSAQTLDEAPESAKLYNEGNKLRKSGNYNGAIEKYDEALKGSNDYRIYYQKGVTYKKLNDYDNAAGAFIKCIEVNPEFDIAYNGLGGTYFSQGKFDEAVESFIKFEELSTKPKLKKQANEYIARSLTKIGLTAKANGNFDKAVEKLVKAVNYHPLDAAYLALAEVYVDKAEYDKALVAADQAINNRKSISKGAGYYYKGLAFKGKKDNVKAKENFEIAVKDQQYKTNSQYELKNLN
jgi:tetratricopeptide (TPR) repeat protein